MKLLVCYIFFVLMTVSTWGSYADVIYQWTDPWGQRQYSKTPVPGAMISDLTELPEIQETTEQQKQEAMFYKLEQMRQQNDARKRKTLDEKRAEQNQVDLQRYCTQLRNNLMSVQLSQARNLALPGYHVFWDNHYSFVVADIAREIRRYCR